VICPTCGILPSAIGAVKAVVCLETLREELEEDNNSTGELFASEKTPGNNKFGNFLSTIPGVPAKDIPEPLLKRKVFGVAVVPVG